MENQPKYKVENPRSLKAWEPIARKEIYRWLTDEDYQKEVCATTMTKESMGPFTKFLYHFACMCECGWGVMVDFSEYRQRVFLPDHYYKWMHELRDKMLAEMEQIEKLKTKTMPKTKYTLHDGKWLCSGYGVFPDGQKCKGCKDCQGRFLKKSASTKEIVEIFNKNHTMISVEIKPRNKRKK